MAVTLPTSTDVRKVRAEANRTVSAQFDLIRTPLLAGLGVGDLALHTLGELPERLTPEELRKQADKVSEQARRTYNELADRGEGALRRIRNQPQVARALRGVEDATGRIERQVDRAVDTAHDRGEEVLGRVSRETRSVGERTARATQRSAARTARNARQASDELAEAVQEAGDEAAHTTRSATRKAANRTQPATR